MRRRTQRSLSDEEVALWAHVTQSVRPGPGHVRPTAPKGGDRADGAPDTDTDTGTEAGPGARQRSPSPLTIKPIVPIERSVKTALKRGREPIHAVLDLHGLRQDTAHARLIGFLRAAQANGGRTVLVITGKGAAGEAMTGAERGVLKRMTPHWLRLPELRPVVLGFDEADLRHGGQGAFYVRLRRTGAGPL